MKQILGAQGEITIIKIDALPQSIETRPATQRNAKGQIIISHSESGNHHVVTGGEVLERIDDKVAKGMAILYALFDGPQSLIQDAPVPHGGYDLPAGIYEFRISREFDPFAEQARRVAD